MMIAESFVGVGYDIAWTVGMGVGVVLFVAALWTWLAARDGRGSSLVHLLLIALVPVIGPVLYLLARRRQRPSVPTES